MGNAEYMGTHPIFESDFDCLTDMSQIASGFLIEDIPDLSGSPAGKIVRNSKKNKVVNVKKEMNKELTQAFVKLIDARLTDGSFKDTNETKKAIKEKIQEMFQTELDISTVPKMLGVEEMEIALTILAIFIFEESGLRQQTIGSKEFLKGEVDENFMEGCNEKLRKKFQN